jgi:hypothetical protein
MHGCCSCHQQVTLQAPALPATSADGARLLDAICLLGRCRAAASASPNTETPALICRSSGLAIGVDSAREVIATGMHGDMQLEMLLI